MSIPKAFMSYSHDSQEHKKWVLDLATRLRNNGVDASLDQWDLGPGDDIPHFMERQLASADRVLLICTERYVQKANAGDGGVGYEKMIVTSELMRRIDSNKAIPILRQTGGQLIPSFLATKFYLDFSRDDQYEAAFDDLVRTLHNAPLFIKPPVANQPFAPVSASEKRTGDGVREVMKYAMETFESQASGDFHYQSLSKVWPASRALLDILLAEAESQELLVLRRTGYIQITQKGKMYALDNKLVS
jgi:hypothetical protein